MRLIFCSYWSQVEISIQLERLDVLHDTVFLLTTIRQFVISDGFRESEMPTLPNVSCPSADQIG